MRGLGDHKKLCPKFPIHNAMIIRDSTYQLLFGRRDSANHALARPEDYLRRATLQLEGGG